MSAFSRFARAVDAVATRIARFFSLIAALAIAGIVVVLIFSSLQRYVLARPIPATEEIAAYLFVLVAFLAMMEGLVAGRQIRIMALWHRLPHPWQGWAMVLGHLLSIAVIAMLVRETFAFALASYEFGARSYVSDLLEWPWMMVIPLALSILALALVARLLVDLDCLLRGRPVTEIKETGGEEVA